MAVPIKCDLSICRHCPRNELMAFDEEHDAVMAGYYDDGNGFTACMTVICDNYIDVENGIDYWDRLRGTIKRKDILKFAKGKKCYCTMDCPYAAEHQLVEWNKDGVIEEKKKADCR